MVELANLDYYKEEVIDKNESFVVTIEKTISIERDQYFIRIGKNTLQKRKRPYIYFHYDKEYSNDSYYIGTFISPKLRQKGFSSILASYLILVNLENDMENLFTITKQSKPFSLHTLMGFSYYPNNEEKLENKDEAIDICVKKGDEKKYLHFRNKILQEEFMNSSLGQNDTFYYLDEIDDSVQVINTVWRNIRHQVIDKDFAFNRSYAIIKSKFHQQDIIVPDPYYMQTPSGIYAPSNQLTRVRKM